MNQFFKHPQAIVETEQVGAGTRIWAYTHILSQAVIGKDCNLCDHVFIENDVRVGDRVTIKCGVQLWDGITIENDVFIGPNATFTNDKFPRSKAYPTSFARTIIKQGASIGANSTILPGITIHAEAMVGAGAVVVKDVPPKAIVTGNPAKITGYVNNKRNACLASHPPLKTRGTRLIQLPTIKDMRGSLCCAEIEKQLPFVPLRSFFIFDVPTKEVRGEHAHRYLQEFLVCLRGSCSILLDDGESRDEIILNSPSTGLYIPPLIWGVQYGYSPEALLLVLASDIYKSEDYIRDYNEFLDCCRN